jgi:mono/diheme cytochrome c family protein
MSNRKSLLHLRTLPPVVVALAGVGLSGAALAQTGNPTTGATLYDTAVPIPGGTPSSCKNCHGAANIFNLSQGTSETAIVGRMSAAIAAPGNAKSMNQYAVWTPQMRADVAAYIASATAAPPPPPLVLPPGTPAPAPAPTPGPVPPSAAPTLSPDTPRFNSTEIGKESATLGVLVTNTTTSAVKLATPAAIPPRDKPAEFLLTTAPSGSVNCVPGYTLEPGTSCSFGVRFAPLASGTRTEKWTIAFTDDVPAREVTLEGAATGSVTSTTTSSPTGSSAANAPTGGAGALGWTSLFGLAAFAVAGSLRRRKD